MSEPRTLYEYHLGFPPEDLLVATHEVNGKILGYFVKVEQCKHGNVNPHIIDRLPRMTMTTKCDGKPEADNG